MAIIWKKSSNFALDIAPKVLTTTESIVLNLQRRGDASHVLHTYTRACGRVNYMVYGAGSKKKSTAIYSPLSLIEVTADIRADRPLPSVKEARLIYYIPQTADIRRQSVALFVTEILYNTLRHPMQDEQMFDFLAGTIHDIAEAEDIENVHLRFLSGFATVLGIGVNEVDGASLLRMPINRKDRQNLIQEWCDYYQLHLEDFRRPKSIDVLTELFD